MESRLGSKKGLLIGSLAVAALLVFTAIPGFAASGRLISLSISPSPTAVSTTVGIDIKARVTNANPPNTVSNPNSIKVTVPTGFAVVNTTANPPTMSPLGAESSTANPSSVITWTGTAVTVNSLTPIQRGQFVTLNLKVTTTDVVCPNTTGSGVWKADASTSSQITGGQPFTQASFTQQLTKVCSSAPTVTIAATTPTTYTAIGGTMTFQATATGVPSPAITWQSSTSSTFSSNVTDITSTCSSVATPSTCSFTTVDSDDGKYYRATANNGVPAATNDVFSNVIQIAYAPPCGTPVVESGGGTTARVVLVKNPVDTDPSTDCDPKPFSLVVGESSIQVLPLATTCTLATCATYVVYSDDWAPEPAETPVPATIVSPTGNPPSMIGEEPEVWCDGLYLESDAPSPSNPDGTYGTSMPNNHQWCRVLQTATPAGTIDIGTAENPNIVPAMLVSEIHLLIGDAVACRRCG